jgi:squalene-hopene/tetraprenyl-beta-curcumene cyclase
VNRLRGALKTATDALVAEMNSAGHWTGELSSSALSTATAIVALGAVDRGKHAALIRSGERWLREHQNTDGGWGDTTRSKSNISTTALCWAALGGQDERAAAWLTRASAGQTLTAAIAARYGKDRTFSVPILMHLAICGRIDWREVMPLPFELAALPHQLFGALQLPVVSYALPALIAIGQAIHHHAPSRNPLARVVRAAMKARTLDVLARIQPDNGGFLEATPLTSFVTMALASTGLRDHRVIRKSVTFLANSVRADGSWPIDTNLATWVTTLAIKALPSGALVPEQKLTLREWLLGQQYRVEHSYTHAAPGGWAWTDLPGGVPDADDTPGALLALLKLGLVDTETLRAGAAGMHWLRGLQNRDGGIPTFCRGWGALPFDRSSPDLTAHALRAWSEWMPHFGGGIRMLIFEAMLRAIDFLACSQREDGSWLPLWFGNEHAPDDINPLYGTTHVLFALNELRDRDFPFDEALAERGAAWLIAAQNDNGGWGGVRGVPSTTEETGLAVKALAGTRHVAAMDRGTAWLIERVESGAWREPAPIGFYFAKLWYYERLYPLIWTVGALGRVAALQAPLEQR